MLLERLEQRPDRRGRSRRRSGPGWRCRRPRPARRSGGRTSPRRAPSTITRDLGCGLARRPARAGQPSAVAASAMTLAGTAAVDPRRAGRRASSSSTARRQLDQPLLDPAGAEDQHDQQPGRRSAATSSTWRTVERESVGYCTIATWWVSCASSRTERCTTSSRSTRAVEEAWRSRASRPRSSA